ncbi:MAG: large-conductance mechanosensitive channel protein MscL [Pirellulales bacterium]
MFQEFKKFAMRGNVIDMAVGIIIGGAFGTVVKSLVDDVIMPPIGILTSGVDFRNLKWEIAHPLMDPAKPTVVLKPAVSINYGAFINSAITFVIVAWAVFLLIKAMNAAETRLQLGGAPAPDAPPPPEDTLLLREIRDELKKK